MSPASRSGLTVGRGARILAEATSAKCILAMLPVVVLVIAIEWCTRSGLSFPVPFLLLYACVVFAGAAAGKFGGVASGLLVGTFVVHSGIVGFGPSTLTGGVFQIILGVTLYVVTGLLLGSSRDQILRLRRLSTSQEDELRRQVDQLGGRFESVIQNSPSAISLKDRSGKFLLVNRRFCEWYGISEEDAVGRTSLGIFPGDLAEMYEAMDREVIATGSVVERARETGFDGHAIRAALITKFPTYNRAGEMEGVGSFTIDMTHHKEMEEKLVQASKMEALGLLTGGVAHDFNNLLMIIQGNAEQLEGLTDGQAELVQSILRATLRGSELTQRLLAFSRRQTLRAEVVDLAVLTADLRDLLARTLGATIEVAISSPDRLWPAFADPAQIENALLNLAINARDAMPDGGRLTIELANTHLADDAALGDAVSAAGDYVELRVSDTGTGMTSEVQAHAFEPFFTTKEAGKGSGLGLSMIFGFAQQSGGRVAIESTVGLGTTVRLYLPRARAAVRAEGAELPGVDSAGGGQHVLVVEDDEDVRALAAAMLESLGYRVSCAGDAAVARGILSNGDRFDLLLSDVVLSGGESGPELARQAQSEFPGLKVVYMSGYSAPSEATQMCEGGVHLNKPFRKRELAEVVRTALN